MNAKHQFKYTYNEGCEDFSPVEVTFEVPGDVTITQMLYNFQCYLRACGFVFDGSLEIVDNDFYNGPCCGDEVCCGLEETSSSLDNEWTKAEKAIKEWNEGIAKLDNEQKKKANEDARKMSDLHYEATKEVVKNKWVHGMCNPPASDWANTKNSDHYDGAASANPTEYSKWLNKNKESDSDNCWNS
jgi:hypothetical protein